jgi:putative endonuclease
MKRKELGAIGEKLARDFLKKKGYKIIDANYRCHEGEIDIVARKKDYLVFIEVRTKASTGFGSPEESVTFAKREKLISSALTYISEHQGLPESWRIDFVAVELDSNGQAKRIELIENAVS